jgi:hypothetical protein
MEITKREFMQQFVLNVRLSGRAADIDSASERTKIVTAAYDLWCKIEESCKGE